MIMLMLGNFVRCLIFQFNGKVKLKVGGNSKAAIVYLSEFKRLFMLSSSLKYLFNNFNQQFEYPIVIFHYGNLNNIIARLLICLSVGPENCELIEIIEAVGINEFPPSFEPSTANADNTAFFHLFPNYHFMDAFFFMKIYWQPWIIANNISYYLRLDSDSYITKKINYDLFNYMESNHLVYGYRVRDGEHPCCSRLLTKFIRLYANEKNIPLSSPEVNWIKNLNDDELSKRDQNEATAFPMTQYYANFEIVHVPSFRDDPHVSSWLQSVWNDERYHVNGIFTNRWGDSLLRFYTIHMFPQLENRIHFFCDLDYFHKWHFLQTCEFTQSSKSNGQLEQLVISTNFLINFQKSKTNRIAFLQIIFLIFLVVNLLI